MNAFLYLPVFLWTTSCLAFLYALKLYSSPDYRFQIQRNNILVPFAIGLVLIFWLGNRPLSGAAFGDTANYAHIYNLMRPDFSFFFSLRGEWFWSFILVICKTIGLSVHGFFTVIEAGYILSVLWAVKRFMPTNPFLGLLFVLTSLMFFTFGTNGIRNGLACHITLLAISFFFDDRYLIGALLCVMAFGIHRSTMLPIAGMFAGRFVIKDMKWAIYFWILSIFLSLTIGSQLTNYIASMGFDSRMQTYQTQAYSHSFSSSGFRWDFLLYSFFPILMGWYVCIKKRIKDDWYRALCITYCLCNAFWVIVIKSAFSNRFAYLSWFIYPIIIAYPLVNLPVWKDQDRKTAMILTAYAGFTLFMYTIYWG